MDKWKEKMYKEGKCPECGKSKSATSVLCEDCRIKRNKKGYAKTNFIRANCPTRCRYCKKECGSQMCDMCKEKMQKYQKKRRLDFIEKGGCKECGKEKINNNFCEKHYLMNMSNKCLGTTKRYLELKDLFDKQNEMCYYTGEKLKLGINSSIDHKIPISKERNNNIENLVWCNLRINIMKNNFTDIEFIEVCKQIAKRW